MFHPGKHHGLTASTAEDASRTWRITRIAAGLGTLGLAADSLISTPLGTPQLELIAIPLCAGMLGWALLMRRSRSLAAANFGFLAINAILISAVTANAQLIAESGVTWVPFRAHQLGALTVALLAPPVAWVGIVVILAVIGTAVIQFALFSPSMRQGIPFGEPWTTLVFGTFAMALLFYRRRADRVERAAAQSETYQRYARIMLAIRDLANTPLQTLVNAVTLLRAPTIELDETIQHIERAVARLTQLDLAMQPFAERLEWRADEEPWDPNAVLGITGTAVKQG